MPGSNKEQDRVRLTKNILARLRARKSRTGIGSRRLLAGATDCPADLTPHTVDGWLAGKAKSAAGEHLNYALKRWEQFPPRMELTQEKLDILRRHMRRTRVSPRMLLKNRADAPAGLSRDQIRSWMNGKTKCVLCGHYEFVVKAWEALPDRAAEYIGITPEILKTLHRHRRRTGLSFQRLLQGKDDLPDQLTAEKIHNWLSGRNRNARKDHLEYVIRQWEQLPERIERVQITQDILCKLRSEKERTGTGPAGLLFNTARERPQGLSSSMINTWFSRSVITARKDHLDYVLDKWENLPDPPQ